MIPKAVVVLGVIGKRDDLVGRIVEKFLIAGVPIPSHQKRTSHVKVIYPEGSAHGFGPPESAVYPALAIGDIVRYPVQNNVHLRRRDHRMPQDRKSTRLNSSH